MTHHEITLLLISLGLLLGTARLFGELVQRWHQPSVVGEILAGIVLGPTVLGQLAPGFSAAIFPPEGSVAIFLDGFTTLAITLFLLVAGMEVDLSTVWKQGGTALRVGFTGIVIPFAIGGLLAYVSPQSLGMQVGADKTVFALFFATAISISALPVIVKTLMDLDLYRSDFGMVVVAACVLNDLIGWMIFALILGLAGAGDPNALPIYATIGLTLGFTAVVLTVGRWSFDRVLPWLQAHTDGLGGVLAFSMTLALFGAAFTEWIGIHAILGSFLVGVAIGDSSHLREETRMVMERFISYIFAPLFFASIGLRVNFVDNFDLPLILLILVIATVAKLAGGLLGARWSGMPRRESWAVGFAMNARGAMEIILGLLALRAGLIRTRLFVALVVMALVTSMISGPLLQILLNRRKIKTVANLLTDSRFIRRMDAATGEEAIRELATRICDTDDLDLSRVFRAVMDREAAMHTGIGHSVAIPHARIPGLSQPIVALGLSEVGVDFDSPDGEPANVIFLLLTGMDEDGSQLEILSSIAKAFLDPEVAKKVLRAANLTEIIAALKIASESPSRPH